MVRVSPIFRTGVDGRVQPPESSTVRAAGEFPTVQTVSRIRSWGFRPQWGGKGLDWSSSERTGRVHDSAIRQRSLGHQAHPRRVRGRSQPYPDAVGRTDPGGYLQPDRRPSPAGSYDPAGLSRLVVAPTREQLSEQALSVDSTAEAGHDARGHTGVSFTTTPVAAPRRQSNCATSERAQGHYRSSNETRPCKCVQLSTSQGACQYMERSTPKLAPRYTETEEMR